MSLYRPSMTFFQEWIDRLGADEEVHFHYQARRGNAPFFNHGSYRDVQLVLEVSGHTLMMYSDGVPSIPEGASVLQFPSAGPGDSHPLESIGYEKADGFYLAIDPRYIRFVSYNENTERWDHVDPEEFGPNPCQVLLDAINAERFFREWTPPTLEDIMQRTWLTKREQQIAMANRRVSDALSHVASYEQRAEGARQELILARSVLSEWGHMTLENFMRSINRYREQLEGIGNDIQVNDGIVSIVIDTFQIQGVDLGPYRIEFQLGASRIHVFAQGDSNISRNGHCHPHVGSDGRVCWGAHESIYNASLGNPFEALFLTAGFLKTGYYAQGAYCRLESWAESNTYYCNYCTVRHGNNAGCPAECGECSSQVNWDIHQHCPRHFLCFDVGDGGAVCSGCQEEKDAAEAKRLEEEKAKKKKAKKSTKKKAKKKTKKKVTKKKVAKKASKRQSRRSIPVPEAAE